MASSTSFYDLAASTTVGAANNTATCVASNNLLTILIIPLKMIVITTNVILFTAAARDWKKLNRQNYTFQCVMSTLLCNTLFLLMSIWMTVDNYPQTSRDPQKDRMTPEKYLWVFSEAFTAALIVGICANVASLTWVTLDSVFYVGRSGTEWGSTSAKKEPPSQLRKTRSARILVWASWILPLLLLILAFIWNCAEECECPSNNFTGDHCPDTGRCSNMWAPLKKDYLVLVMLFWMMEVVILLVFLYRGVRKHQRTTKAPSSANEDVTAMTPHPPTDNETAKEEEIIAITRRTGSVLKRKFSSKLNFSICLTILLIITLLPATISSFIDICVTRSSYHTMTLVSTSFIFFYCACCPILMWKFLPSLRSSTVKICIDLRNGRIRKSPQRPAHEIGPNN